MIAESPKPEDVKYNFKESDNNQYKVNLATYYSSGDLRHFNIIMQLTFCLKVTYTYCRICILIFYYLILRTRLHCFASVPVRE